MKRLMLLVLFLSVCPAAYGLSITSGVIPITISPFGQFAINPQIKMSADGKATAIWLVNSTTIQAAYYNGTAWGPVTTIAEGGSFPQLAVDGVGNAYVVWVGVSTANTPNQIFVSRFNAATPAAEWSRTLLSTNAGFNSAPQISVNAMGNAVAVWARAQPQQIYASSYSVTAGTWLATPVLIATGTNGFPQVSIDNVAPPLTRGIVEWVSVNAQVQVVTIAVP